MYYGPDLPSVALRNTTICSTIAAQKEIKPANNAFGTAPPVMLMHKGICSQSAPNKRLRGGEGMADPRPEEGKGA